MLNRVESYPETAHVDPAAPPTRSCPVRAPSGYTDPLYPTIFHESWWLDAATGGQYEEVTVTSGGRTVGRFPYLLKRRLGLTISGLPELTHFLGPAVDEGNGGQVSRNLRRHDITRDLIDQLPRFSYFSQRLHGGTPDALPFLDRHFRTEVMFTYEVGPAPEAALWSNLRDKARNVIRRAQEQMELVDLDPAEFCSLYEENLSRRGELHNYMFKVHAAKVFEAALMRRRGRLLGALDRSSNIAAAVFYVWDEQFTYYLLTTRAPETHNGVVSLLIWEAMRESAANGRTFDFDGVGTKGSGLFFTAFGGEVRPRYTVEHSTPSFRWANAAALQSRKFRLALTRSGAFAKRFTVA